MDSKIPLWLKWGIGTSFIGAFFYIYTWYQEQRVFGDMPGIAGNTSQFSIVGVLAYMILGFLVGWWIGKRSEYFKKKEDKRPWVKSPTHYIIWLLIIATTFLIPQYLKIADKSLQVLISWSGIPIVFLYAGIFELMKGDKKQGIFLTIFGAIVLISVIVISFFAY